MTIRDSNKHHPRPPRMSPTCRVEEMDHTTQVSASWDRALDTYYIWLWRTGHGPFIRVVRRRVWKSAGATGGFHYYPFTSTFTSVDALQLTLTGIVLAMENGKRMHDAVAIMFRAGGATWGMVEGELLDIITQIVLECKNEVIHRYICF